METKTVKFVVAILMFMTIAFTVQSAVLYSEMTELRTEVNGHADDIYDLMLMLHHSGRKITIAKLAKEINCSTRTIHRNMCAELKREKELLNKQLCED